MVVHIVQLESTIQLTQIINISVIIWQSVNVLEDFITYILKENNQKHTRDFYKRHSTRILQIIPFIFCIFYKRNFKHIIERILFLFICIEI